VHRLAIVLLAAGCGRFGFARTGGTTDASSPSDSSDAPVVTADAIADHLVAYFPMDSLVDNVASDATGHGYDLTCPNACPTVVAGKIGSAFEYDGATEWQIALAPASAFGASPAYTVAWWQMETAAATQLGCPISKLYGSGTDDSWQLVTHPGLLQFVTSIGSDSPDDSLSDNADLADGAWHHYAMVYDGTTKELFLDGHLAAADEPSGTSQWDDGALVIGADLDSGSPVCPTNAALDDVRIYSIALSPAAIESLAAM
jgi:Concanavalin A-like lectin/glucanases superfamily